MLLLQELPDKSVINMAHVEMVEFVYTTGCTMVIHLTSGQEVSVPIKDREEGMRILGLSRTGIVAPPLSRS